LTLSVEPLAGGSPVERPAVSSQHRQRLSARWSWVIVGICWCAFIVGTSSTVILPHDFFAWVATHIFVNETSFRRFAIFWRSSWFVSVKGWHAIEFAILFAIALVVLDRLTASGSRRNVTFAVAFSIVFAVLDEYHQTFVPGRGGTWTDVAIDGLGVAVAGLIALKRRRLTSATT
jgi:uncharacterized protein YfiM (DUF2279 family)